jgi:hypothetical protein
LPTLTKIGSQTKGADYGYGHAVRRKDEDLEMKATRRSAPAAGGHGRSHAPL